MKISTLSSVLALSILAPGAFAERSFFEQPIGEVTVGYDAKKNRTLICSYNITASGPDEIESPAIDAIAAAAKHAGKAAVAAYQATMADSFTRTKAATSTFKTEFRKKLNNELKTKYGDSVKLRLVQRLRWEDKLVLKLRLSDPAVERFQEFHNGFRDNVPPILNRAIDFHLDKLQNDINIAIDFPPEVTNILAALPGAKILDSAGSDLSAALIKTANAAAKLEDELSKFVHQQMSKAAKVAEKEVEDAAQHVAKEFEDAAKKVAADAEQKANEAKKALSKARGLAKQQAQKALVRAEDDARKAKDDLERAAQLVLNPTQLIKTPEDVIKKPTDLLKKTNPLVANPADILKGKDSVLGRVGGFVKKLFP